MRQRGHVPARFLDFRFRLFLAANEGGKLAAPLLDDLVQLGYALLERLLLLLMRGGHLLLGGQGNFALGQTAVSRVALLTQTFQLRREFLDLGLARLLARLRFIDRKSTRLNSSHQTNSYAVFCL